jgi:aspartate carbamoyltransferase catalytic subunit
MGEVEHIISAAPFTPVFLLADQLSELDANPDTRRENAQKYVGRRAVNLFYQESTRTRVSFEMAEVALGMGYSSTENAKEFSSAVKGETYAHTVEVIEQYSPDLLVVRFDQEGAAAEAANLVKIPLINAGDGSGEHPTQAFLDAYTIREQIGRLDDLKVVFMGDLKFGRTIRSLVHVLSKGRSNHFDFISHPDFSLPDDIKETLASAPDITYDEHFHASDLHRILPEADVVYVTRTQKNLGATALNVNEYRITEEVANLLPANSIILHPMPIDRSDVLKTEIAPEVDRHPRARYYRQAGNGLYVRMALIERLMEGEPILAESS